MVLGFARRRRSWTWRSCCVQHNTRYKQKLFPRVVPAVAVLSPFLAKVSSLIRSSMLGQDKIPVFQLFFQINLHAGCNGREKYDKRVVEERWRQVRETPFSGTHPSILPVPLLEREGKKERTWRSFSSVYANTQKQSEARSQQRRKTACSEGKDTLDNGRSLYFIAQ